MPELTFPLYYSRHGMYFKWLSQNAYIKFFFDVPGFDWGISKHESEFTSFGTWLNDNSLSATQIDEKDFQNFYQILLDKIQEETPAFRP